MDRFSFFVTSPSVLAAARLEELFSEATRRRLFGAVFILLCIVAFLFFLSFTTPHPALGDLSTIIETFGWLQDRLFGAFFLLGGALWALLLVGLYSLSTSRTVPFLKARLKEGEHTYFLNSTGAPYILFLQVMRQPSLDVTLLYDLWSRDLFFQLVVMRLGIPARDFLAFVGGGRESVEVSQELLFETLIYEAHEVKTSVLGAREFLLLLFDLDKNFEKFLFRRGIHKKELAGTATWVLGELEARQARARWWEKQVLARIPGIGKGIGFGYTYTLDKYAVDVQPSPSLRARVRMALRKEEVRTVEEILSRSGQLNILLIGEAGSGRRELLRDLALMIQEGSIVPALEHKRLVSLDTPALTAVSKMKGALEELLITIMNEAVRAGNILLVIDNFPEFVESAAVLGVDIVSFLEPYLGGSQLQVIALAEPGPYHRVLEPRGALMTLFQKVELTEPTPDDMVVLLEQSAEDLEKRFPITFTYQSLYAAVSLADRYIMQGVMPEKAVDLLDRAAVAVTAAKREFITKEDMERVVHEITQIPLGEAGKEEAEKLLRLEDLLHKRVVDQEEAIRAVAGALRRVRSGLHAGERPIGSFLFLGPTGVGKTETAKSLAAVYFGSEDALIRFDMSEFQGADGVEKLIGSSRMDDPGMLTVALRRRPFSLLLFDEFEKSSREVVNLFLQILEEGFFTDGYGKRVSVRDALIIATSNAGSNLIWDLVRAGKDPAQLQKEVIDNIRREGVFSPEILNRFSAIVVYHPLSKEHLYEVARLLLDELVARLAGQDITLVITDDLVEKVVELGYDPAMGARPMRRVITDRVEQVIARRLLEGTLQRGSEIQFSKEEVETL